MATKKRKKEVLAMLSAEDLVAGLRRRGGHLPTKASEAALKKKKKRNILKGARFE
jgi:hypothetical protein